MLYLSIGMFLFGEWLCGTPYIMEHGIKLPRPVNQTTYDTTHFRIHYDTTGSQAVTIEYARQIAEIAEYSWEVLVDSMGYDEPPPDNGAGGDNRYDIYIIELTGGVLGYTQPEGSGPDPNQEDAYSHIAVDRYLGGYVYATVSHEFMHAVEFSYTGNDGTWFMENCAVWAEEMVYPADNQYIGYLSGTGPLKRPNYEITSNAGSPEYWYAGVVWPLFLMFWENDTDLIRAIWDTAGLHWGNHTKDDIDAVLRRDYGDSLENALADYAVWRWFVSGRYDNWHWSEANLWPGVMVLRTHHSYPASGNEGSFPIRGPGGCDFVVFDSWGAADSLYFYFDGEDGPTWGVRVIGYRGGSSNPSDIYEMNVNTNGYGSMAVPTLDYDTLVLVPYCTSWYSTTPDLSFIYWTNVVEVSEDELPSLVLSGQVRGKTLFFNLPCAGLARVSVYDAGGRLVLSNESRFERGENNVPLGPALSPGVYFWRLQFNDQSIGDKAVLF
ncbi:MAG: MXAN_6640 family putative metalloprotease [candidate division WOR-3 bacterium]